MERGIPACLCCRESEELRPQHTSKQTALTLSVEKFVACSSMDRNGRRAPCGSVGVLVDIQETRGVSS